jgi:hypothetical protein
MCNAKGKLKSVECYCATSIHCEVRHTVYQYAMMFIIVNFV